MGRNRLTKNRHLLPGMQQKGKAFYLAIWNPNTQKVEWQPLGSDYTEALLKYSKLRATGGGIEPKQLFKDLAAEYVRAEFDKLASGTRDNYTRALQNLLKAFGDAPVVQLTAAAFGRYMDLRSSRSAANCEKAVASKILELGIRWGWCTENVARKISYHPTTRRRRIITRAEWQAIRLAAKSDLIPVFMDLAFVTGLRVGDVLNIRWKQVTDEGLYVLQGKNKVEGYYELTEDLRGILDRAKRLHGRSGKIATLLRADTTIIHTRKLQPYTYYGFRSIWRKTCERARIENAHIHDIRRTAITAAKLAGRNPAEFSLHRTESEAAAYVVEVPRVRPLEMIR